MSHLASDLVAKVRMRHDMEQNSNTGPVRMKSQSQSEEPVRCCIIACPVMIV